MDRCLNCKAALERVRAKAEQTEDELGQLHKWKSTMEKNNKQNFPNQRPQKVNSKEHQEFRAGLNEILTNVEVHVKSNKALTTDANRGHSSRNAHATNKMQ